MTQLERDYTKHLQDQREWRRRQEDRDRARDRRLLGTVIGLIFFWAVTVTALLGFLH